MVWNYSRSSIDVKENVSVLELLGIGPRLEVLLEGVLADMVGSDGGDGGGVDERIFGSLGGHVCYVVSRIGDVFWLWVSLMKLVRSTEVWSSCVDRAGSGGCDGTSL